MALARQDGFIHRRETGLSIGEGRRIARKSGYPCPTNSIFNQLSEPRGEFKHVAPRLHRFVDSESKKSASVRTLLSQTAGRSVENTLAAFAGGRRSSSPFRRKRSSPTRRTSGSSKRRRLPESVALLIILFCFLPLPNEGLHLPKEYLLLWKRKTNVGICLLVDFEVIARGLAFVHALILGLARR